MKKPGTCHKCGKDWIKLEEESSEHHKVLKPGCDCYNKELRLHKG